MAFGAGGVAGGSYADAMDAGGSDDVVVGERMSNVVRCFPAMEGLGTLALVEPSLLDEAEAMVERYLWDQTPAMKCRCPSRAKDAGKKHRED